MSFLLLYSWQVDLHTLRQVYTDSINLDAIGFQDLTMTFPPSSQPGDGTNVANICNPNGNLDLYQYFSQGTVPYVNFVIQHNSPTCGYIPPACDIFIKSFVKTDETDIGADNGTANLFAISSFSPIVYTLETFFGVIIATNSTGLFIGIAPGDYVVGAKDANGCSVSQNFTINPFTSALTHFKYRLKFKSVDNGINTVDQWELRLLDVHHNYDATLFPIDITGTDTPVKKKKEDPNEDKTTVICSTQLTIELHFTGDDFTPDEFKVVEKSWKVELWRNGALDFQGWLIPDEMQDFYEDAPYAIELIATDGLPSLKGNVWGNGSGGKGYSNFQIQQYGLAQWGNLVKQCLDQLGYNYGNVIIVNSLQFNGAYSNQLWINIATWSDILYDGSGNAVDTYTALTNLLGAFNLQIFQFKGIFYLVNWNDLFYQQTPLKATDFANAFYIISGDFATVLETGPGAVIDSGLQSPAIIGYNQVNAPINPPQSLNLDKAYNIEATESFQTLALLFSNPSFEIGAVQGQIPTGMVSQVIGGLSVDAFCNNDITAYDGSWELRVSGTNYVTNPPYLKIFPLIIADQINQKLNLSFKWRPTISTSSFNPVPSIAIIAVNTSGTFYWNFLTATGVPQWSVLIPGQEPVLGIPLLTNGDIDTWQDFTTTTDPWLSPTTLEIRIYPCATFNQGTIPHFSNGSSSDICDIDMLELTVQDASNPLSLQVSEQHDVTAVTGIPNANLKTVDLSLFTFPTNKRVAGNVFNFNDYTTGIVANLWNFALHTADKQDRLPAAVTKAIARNYSRPMDIFEGDIQTNYLPFFSLFQLINKTGKLYKPFSLEQDCRNNICHVILVEIDDTDAQDVYTYTAIFANNARQITTG